MSQVFGSGENITITWTYTEITVITEAQLFVIWLIFFLGFYCIAVNISMMISLVAARLGK